jgi:hypothetical protein
MRGVKKQKAPRKAMLFMVAPRPGLEPGTYGLTENSFLKLCLFYEVCKP